MTIQIYDILKNDFWYKKVIESIPDIVSSGHHNAKNYEDLESRLKKYECFTAIVEEDKLLAISGLYNGGEFPYNIARIVDRTYYYDWNIRPGMVSDKRARKDWYNTYYAIPYQIQVAKDRGFDSVFISVQNPKKRRSLEKLSHIHSKYLKYKFELLPNLYNTLPITTPEGNARCWQNISVHYITDSKSFDLPSITIEEYYERYKDSEGIR